MKPPKILIVNCYSDNHRHARGNRLFAPQTMVTGVLAGQLHPAKVDVRLWCEFKDGPFLRLEDLKWPDMLVLSGLNTAFDRMRHLCAYARTLNPSICVVGGGPAVRMLPKLSRRYFDHVCVGDAEELVDVVDSVFGGQHRAEVVTPRFDLMNWSGPIGYAESSKNCNFRCSFCSMTAEGRPFTTHDLPYLERQLRPQAHRRGVMMLDQNFFGGSRAGMTQRLDRMRELHQQGVLKGWSALVTADFFKDEGNLKRFKQAGCIGFFTGVESFDAEQIAKYNKKQNLAVPQLEAIHRTLEAGLVFHYGLVFDLFERSVADVRAEIDILLSEPRITLPSFLSLAIPLLGTPLFKMRLNQGALLPRLKLRDMDGRSVMTRTVDPPEVATDFARRMDVGLLPKSKLAVRAASILWNYSFRLTPIALASALADVVAMAFPRLGSAGRDGFRSSRGGRSYYASTEPLGSLYKPSIPIPLQLQGHFEPLHVTDPEGGLAPELINDLG
jgi:hypothetical protein